MILKYKYPILSVVIILGLLAFISQRTSPIPVGQAEDYWEFACGVELEKFDGYFPYAYSTGIFPAIDEWHFYHYQEHHGRHVFKIKKESLINEAEELFVLLDNPIVLSVQKKNGNFSLDAKNERRLKCKRLKESVASNPNNFLEELNSLAAHNPNRAKEIQGFNKQFELAKLYWVSILFEAIFLSIWWLFTFHPKVWGKYKFNTSTRLAWSPLILFIPHYLGYAPYLFSFGPSGGILYPLPAMLLSLPFGWIPFNSIEIELFKFIPQPLFYISQLPFSPMAISFMGGVSPTVLCLYGVFVLITSRMICRCRKKKANKSIDSDATSSKQRRF